MLGLKLYHVNKWGHRGRCYGKNSHLVTRLPNCCQLTTISTDNRLRSRITFTCWRHQMETFSALPALCEGNLLLTGGFPSQRPVTRSFDAFFDLRLNKRLSKQSRRRWFETPSRSLWRHRNYTRTGQSGHHLLKQLIASLARNLLHKQVLNYMIDWILSGTNFNEI